MGRIKFENFQALLVVGEIDPEQIAADWKIAPGDQEILAGENIKIAEVRGLVHWINLKPFSGGRKIAIILGADKMTTEAANALLKTLEEPPPYAKIILTTLNEQRILPTIHSRCQKIRIMVSPQKDIAEGYLTPDEINKMSIKQKFDAAAKIAELAPSEILNILTAWQIYFREKLLAGDDRIAILKEIGRAKDLLNVNISVKLLLENLVLKF